MLYTAGPKRKIILIHELENKWAFYRKKSKGFENLFGLVIAIVIFNFLAFKTNRLTSNQTLHIWTFTVALQISFDIFVEFKYFGYWYFTRDIEWEGVLPHTILIPPVNMLFLSFYPFRKGRLDKFVYIFSWTIGILIYELITLLPEPWGYFHNGWWSIWHSVVLDPILFLLLLGFYQIVLKLERLSIPGKVPE